MGKLFPLLRWIFHIFTCVRGRKKWDLQTEKGKNGKLITFSKHYSRIVSTTSSSCNCMILSISLRKAG